MCHQIVDSAQPKTTEGPYAAARNTNSLVLGEERPTERAVRKGTKNVESWYDKMKKYSFWLR